jgi:Ca-activated chloride channel family protein
MAAAGFLWSHSGPSAVAQGDDRSSASISRDRERAVQLRSDLVTLHVTVTDLDGRFVTGLRKEHFAVYENKIEQPITHFTQEDAPVSLGMILDISGSMKEKMGQALNALARFLETSHKDDDIFLIGFNDRVRLVSDFTTVPENLINRLVLVQPKGRTALYDAVYAGLEKVQQGSRAKRALLIISDGQDNSSRYRLRSINQSIKESDSLIYGIGIQGLYVRDQREEERGRILLKEISEVTGGRAFFPFTEQQLITVCSSIALELRRQYSIGYIPTTEARDGKWHQLKVEVRRSKGWPPLQVRTRRGYYAPRA